jgi:hypothetical protein
MKPFIVLAFCQLLPWLGDPFPEERTAAANPGPGKALSVVVYAAHGNPDRLYIRFDNPRQHRVSVLLLTEGNDKLGAWRTRRHQFNLRLDISYLPDGAYRVEVADAHQTFVKTLHVSTLYRQRTQRSVALADPGFAPVPQ